jgi:hypothetical protein
MTSGRKKKALASRNNTRRQLFRSVSAMTMPYLHRGAMIPRATVCLMMLRVHGPEYVPGMAVE